MTIAINKTAAFAALNKFATARVQLIQALHDAGYTVETARNVVIEWACAKTDAEFRWNKAKTKAMLKTDHPKYEGAKTVVRDVMLMIQGMTRRESSGATEKDPVEQAIKLLGKLTPAQLKKVLAAVAK